MVTLVSEECPYHTSVFSFCETHPQYVKYFTQESKLHLSFDTRITAKFAIIMETMGYLLLNFNKKPKQLDRLVGYIAMIHKDMQLDEQDLNNLVTSLFEYLTRMYPAQMTVECKRAMSKFMESVVRQLYEKMKTFREYDAAQLRVATRSKLLWERCPLFAEPSIFGKSKLYWDERKKQWDTRLGVWAVQTAQEQEPISGEPISPNTLKPKTDLDEEEKIDIGFLQRKASELERKRIASDIAASRMALLRLKKTITKHAENDVSPPTRAKKHPQRRVSLHLPETVSTSRERHRAKNFIQDVSQNDATTLSIDRLKLDKILPKDKKNDDEMQESEITAVKLHRTARERRRERRCRSMSI
ncbi:uncharacterized protein LOC126857711 isoform X2 [Cataglyphis hispanica]|uniref:uncharacterized protein LOC126857711 isoform X2 n=1 Tax=Cataglyphis hispanica TaxID=1086592 RepID=UPI0021802C1C|nr:uncharacterized protein LOC126857711 isoform X2 [Cataglyphis hispanica]